MYMPPMPSGPAGPGAGAPSASGVGSPMPGSAPMPPADTNGGSLSALLSGAGGGDPSANPMSAVNGALAMLDQLEMQVSQLALALPGAEQAVAQIVQGLQTWRQTVVVGMAPTPQEMPGAQSFMG